jgi:phosphopantothenoylcysteine decarboxylase/phosphopantothenoylcysteine decarboxylase/phosphopantothenate--cysteine ligase
MLTHPATQSNLQTLQARGCHFIETQSGMLACGYEGPGKLAPVETIVDSVTSFFQKA